MREQYNRLVSERSNYKSVISETGSSKKADVSVRSGGAKKLGSTFQRDMELKRQMREEAPPTKVKK